MMSSVSPVFRSVLKVLNSEFFSFCGLEEFDCNREQTEMRGVINSGGDFIYFWFALYIIQNHYDKHVIVKLWSIYPCIVQLVEADGI